MKGEVEIKVLLAQLWILGLWGGYEEDRSPVADHTLRICCIRQTAQLAQLSLHQQVAVVEQLVFLGIAGSSPREQADQPRPGEQGFLPDEISHVLFLILSHYKVEAKVPGLSLECDGFVYVHHKTFPVLVT